jgi:hypothetical protein
MYPEGVERSPGVVMLGPSLRLPSRKAMGVVLEDWLKGVSLKPSPASVPSLAESTQPSYVFVMPTETCE